MMNEKVTFYWRYETWQLGVRTIYQESEVDKDLATHHHTIKSGKGVKVTSDAMLAMQLELSSVKWQLLRF